MTCLRRVSPLLLVAVAGCLYGFSGGGGLPRHIETVYVPPVENRTARFALTERFTSGLLEAVRGRLGAQFASEGSADAVVRASLTRFREEAVSIQGREGLGAEVFQRRVTLSADVEIRDLVRDEVIWSSSVSGSGEYTPEDETEETGIELALENLIQKVVDGAQSQW